MKTWIVGLLSPWAVLVFFTTLLAALADWPMLPAIGLMSAIYFFAVLCAFLGALFELHDFKQYLANQQKAESK